FRPSVINRYILTFSKTSFVEPLMKRRNETSIGKCISEETNYRQYRLLCAQTERPHRDAANKRDELAAPHSITSSARARSGGGIVRPRAFAVVRLMTRLNLVGCSTGMSPGFVPRRILSTSSAARRN